jgi:pSer/pThr/pTyr-binding forkhead associated (FHA) protein
MAEYNMNKERYTIGRLPDNDVRIDNPAVSGHHSLIINILSDSFLEDLNSTNGTYVNGKLIKKHALQHGDVITVGHHQMRFVEGAADEESTKDEFARTMIIDNSQAAAQAVAQAEQATAVGTARQFAETGKHTRAPVGDMDTAKSGAAETIKTGAAETIKTDAAKTVKRDASETVKSEAAKTVKVDLAPVPTPAPVGKVQVLNGSFAGREVELSKALTTLGQPGVQVVAITRRNEGFFIVAVENKKGGPPSVNGEPLSQKARKLSDNDVVELIGIKMGFFLG